MGENPRKKWLYCMAVKKSILFFIALIFSATFSDTVYTSTTITPQIITHSYMDLSKVQHVSRFRSAIGHNYSFDPAEPCRNMKHYFEIANAVDMPLIMSPADGTIVRIEPEWAGDKIDIITKAAGHEYRITIFHITRAANNRLFVGAPIHAGDILGTHVGAYTSSDIAIMDEQGTLFSYFDLMTDSVFQEFSGVFNISTRADMVISAAARDADPLTCGPAPEQVILTLGNIPNWVERR